MCVCCWPAAAGRLPPSQAPSNISPLITHHLRSVLTWCRCWTSGRPVFSRCAAATCLGRVGAALPCPPLGCPGASWAAGCTCRPSCLSSHTPHTPPPNPNTRPPAHLYLALSGAGLREGGRERDPLCGADQGRPPAGALHLACLLGRSSLVLPIWLLVQGGRSGGACSG